MNPHTRDAILRTAFKACETFEHTATTKNLSDMVVKCIAWWSTCSIEELNHQLTETRYALDFSESYKLTETVRLKAQYAALIAFTSKESV